MASQNIKFLDSEIELEEDLSDEILIRFFLCQLEYMEIVAEDSIYFMEMLKNKYRVAFDEKLEKQILESVDKFRNQ